MYQKHNRCTVHEITAYCWAHFPRFKNSILWNQLLGRHLYFTGSAFVSTKTYITRCVNRYSRRVYGDSIAPLYRYSFHGLPHHLVLSGSLFPLPRKQAEGGDGRGCEQLCITAIIVHTKAIWLHITSNTATNVLARTSFSCRKCIFLCDGDHPVRIKPADSY